MALRTQAKVTLHSSDGKLERGFERLKHQALHWVFEGCPVGDYYEAALPNRDAFCMRDVSHQCTGGEVLGLSSHNKNMFRKFVRSISDARDWCAHWEIDRWDRPCPVDHKDDQDFWYNLPANFDLLHACWRMYLWTGDREYLSHPDFDYFYAQVMEAYISRWDSNGDGLPDRGRNSDGSFCRRGVAGYAEDRFSWNRLQTATDMVAAMARAHLSYSKICKQLGRVGPTEMEGIYRKRGEALLERLSRDFFTEKQGYARGLDFDGNLLYMEDEYTAMGSLLYWDAVPDRARRENILDIYASNMETAQIEDFSHYPEIQWRYGRNKEAMRSLWRLMDPELPRKEYPEASYCAIGAVATGLMGICPQADSRRVDTLSGLVDTDWAELRYVPVLGGEISVRHEGHLATELSFEGNCPITWRPAFHGGGRIEINGAAAATQEAEGEFTGQSYIFAEVTVNPGETITAAKKS